MNTKGLGALLALTVSAAPLCAGTTVFDFESEATGSLGFGSAFTQGDRSILIAVDQAQFSIVDTDGDVPSWGSRSLLLGGGVDLIPMRVTFIGGASAVSLELGDYGGKTDDVVINVYSGADATGTLLESTLIESMSDISTDGPDMFSTSTIDGSMGIGSIEILASGRFGASSIYFDNIGFTVPAPGAAPILGISILAVRRRR